MFVQYFKCCLLSDSLFKCRSTTFNCESWNFMDEDLPTCSSNLLLIIFHPGRFKKTPLLWWPNYFILFCWKHSLLLRMLRVETTYFFRILLNIYVIRD